MDINTTYPGSSVQTTSDGYGVSGGADLSGVLAEIIRRRFAQQQVPPPRGFRGRSMNGLSGETHAPVQQERPVGDFNARHAVDHSQEGPPLTIAADGWLLPHYEMDTLHMNPQQRKDFLPSGSGFSQGGANTTEDNRNPEHEELLKLKAQIAALSQGGR